MDHEWKIKSFESQCGKRRAFIIARKDGFFRFDEHAFYEDMGYRYWSPSFFSGLYETAELAEKEARSILPWLRKLPPSRDPGQLLETSGARPAADT